MMTDPLSPADIAALEAALTLALADDEGGKVFESLQQGDRMRAAKLCAFQLQCQALRTDFPPCMIEAAEIGEALTSPDVHRRHAAIWRERLLQLGISRYTADPAKMIEREF